MAGEFEWIPVESGKIEAVAYEPATSTLAVKFKHNKEAGTYYTYSDVSNEKYTRFLQGDGFDGSVGKFFNSEILGQHGFQKITPGD